MCAVVRRHQLVVFIVVTYGLSWAPSLWSPGGLLPVGPLLAALLVLALRGGRPAVSAFLGKIVRWRVGAVWYALALLGPPLLTFGAVAVNLTLGATPSGAAPPASAVVVQFAVVLVTVALGEEPAWRGYALPRLLATHDATTAALGVGLIHVVWHVPLFGVEYDLANGVPWALSVFCLSILTAWMWVNTGGSLLLPMLLHAANNSVAFAWSWFAGANQLRLWWIWAALWVAAALAVLAILNRCSYCPSANRTLKSPAVQSRSRRMKAYSRQPGYAQSRRRLVPAGSADS